MLSATAIVVDATFAITGIAVAVERRAAHVVPTRDPSASLADSTPLASGAFRLAGEQQGLPIRASLSPDPPPSLC